MCDYSLEMYASRLPQEGETLVTTRFPSGSIGVIAPGACTTAVCHAYGTRLRLENIPACIQETYMVGQVEEVTFIQLKVGLYRDGVRLPNGQEFPLWRLGTGVLVTLLPAVTRNFDKAVNKIIEGAKAAAPESVPGE